MSVYDRGTYDAEKWEPKKIVLTLTGKRVRGTYALFQAGRDREGLDDPPHGRARGGRR